MALVSENAPQSNAIIYQLSIIGFLAIFSTTISKNPVLPIFTNALGGDNRVIGIISSISPIAGIVFSFPVGFLADKIGKRFMLIIASLVFASAPLLYLFVNNAWTLIPLRFFHGMSTALLGPVASAIIASTYQETKGQKLGTYSSITLIGRTLAPLFGGFLIAFFSNGNTLSGCKAVYIAAFIASVPTVLLTLRMKPDHSGLSKKLSMHDFFISLKSIIGNKAIFATALVDLSIYFCFGIFETFTPGYLKTTGYDARFIGLVFSLQVITIALTKPLFGILADKIDNRIQIAAGLALLALSIALLPLSHSIPALIISCLLIGIGMSVATVATSAYTADLAAKDSIGASMGALSAIMDIGHSCGPLIAGFVITSITMQAGFFSGTILSGIILVYFLFTLYSRK